MFRIRNEPLFSLDFRHSIRVDLLLFLLQLELANEGNKVLWLIDVIVFVRNCFYVFNDIMVVLTLFDKYFDKLSCVMTRFDAL